MANNADILGQMLDAVVRGGSLRGGGNPSGPGSAGGLGDILGSILGGGGAGQAGQAPGAGNLGDILGGLLGGATGAGQAAPGSAGGPSGGLGDILGNILGGATGANAGAGQAGPSGGGLADVLGGLLGGAQAGNDGSPPANRSATPSVDPTQGGGMGNLAKYGGIAVISVLALQALKKWQSQKGAAGASAPAAMPSAAGFDPQKAPGGADALSGLLVKAMIGATQADGVIDDDEQRKLVGRLDQLGISPAARSAIAQQLTQRIDPSELADAATTPEMALQVYAASVLAISIDTPQERAYLDKLARALGVDAGLKAQVEQTLGHA